LASGVPFFFKIPISSPFLQLPAPCLATTRDFISCLHFLLPCPPVFLLKSEALFLGCARSREWEETFSLRSPFGVFFRSQSLHFFFLFSRIALGRSDVPDRRPSSRFSGEPLRSFSEFLAFFTPTEDLSSNPSLDPSTVSLFGTIPCRFPLQSHARSYNCGISLMGAPPPSLTEKGVICAFHLF